MLLTAQGPTIMVCNERFENRSPKIWGVGEEGAGELRALKSEFEEADRGRVSTAREQLHVSCGWRGLFLTSVSSSTLS